MPSIARPQGDAALKHQREFAILASLDPENTGKVDQKDMEEYASRYGCESEVKKLSGDEIKFEDFAQAFHKDGQKVEGKGNCFGYAAKDDSGKMEPYKFERRTCDSNDVHIKITYSGMCHSDLHQVKNDWAGATYPMVPGHEMVGVVVQVGKDVKKVKVGEFAAVGNMVDSCQSCEYCKQDEEMFCNDIVMTYNSKKGKGPGEVTYGGYSSHIVVREEFVLKIAPNLHVPGGAPLLCAGITVWSPMRYYGCDKPDVKLAVQGLGGLGHMAVKFGKALGQHVTVISRSDDKKETAMKELGADDFLISKDEDAMKQAAMKFDAIIDCVSAPHDLQQMLSLLKPSGKLIILGIPTKPYEITASSIIPKRRMIAGSLIGGVKETQEMLDFCAEKNITSMVEVVTADKINESFERMHKGDVKYRFVIDVQASMINEE